MRTKPKTTTLASLAPLTPHNFLKRKMNDCDSNAMCRYRMCALACEYVTKEELTICVHNSLSDE